jgi:hypothetical protein
VGDAVLAAVFGDVVLDVLDGCRVDVGLGLGANIRVRCAVLPVTGASASNELGLEAEDLRAGLHDDRGQPDAILIETSGQRAEASDRSKESHVTTRTNERFTVRTNSGKVPTNARGERYPRFAGLLASPATQLSDHGSAVSWPLGS